MSKRVKRYLIIGLGWIFLVVGVLGLFFPILQGILFLLIGFILLSRESEWAQCQLGRLKTRHSKFAKKYDDAEPAPIGFGCGQRAGPNLAFLDSPVAGWLPTVPKATAELSGHTV